MERGKLVVEKVCEKSTLTRCFAMYPLKFIFPKKVGPSHTDVVWIYAITYGGGIVSGDKIGCDITVADDCTAVLTTQSSTKVYKSVGSKCSEQILEATVGRDAFLVIIPDPVTCFSTAKYSQTQIFRVMPESSLIIVDWVTSGRHESGEKWAFSYYKSSNRIFLHGDEPLFLDTTLLEQGSLGSISDRMQEYQVIAMIVLWGPKLKLVQNQIQEDVKKLMSQHLHHPSKRPGSMDKRQRLSKPSFVASCSPFGPQGRGVVVRIASTTTESVYNFLQNQLASLEPLLGVSPYR